MIHQYLSAWVHVLIGKVRDERGLSQSTENALLVVGAVAVAAVVVATVSVYVKAKLDGLG